MKVWWLNLSDRERGVVSIGVVLIALLLFYVFIWTPVTTTYQSLQLQVQSQKNLLLWMKQAGGATHQLRSEGFTVAKTSRQPILLIVEKSLSEQGLSVYLKKIQQTRSHQLSLTFEKVPFDLFIAWLQMLIKKNGVSVLSMRVTKTAAVGLVDVRMILESVAI